MSEQTVDGDVDLIALLEKLCTQATPHLLGMQILRSDSQFDRLTGERAEQLVRIALNAGATAATTARQQFGCDNPLAIAARIGIPIAITNADHRYGDTLQYAEYYTTPPRIRLYQRAIDRLQAFLLQPEIAACLQIGDAAPIFVAHEIYHHFDAVHPAGALTRRHRVTVLRIGRWRWTSGLASMAEIAAGAFAQQLLGLRFHPKLLDLITLFDVNPLAAAAMARAVLSKCRLHSCTTTSG
jgi:hypothetical protein